MSNKYDECVITGCDAKTEWQLEWFIDNYKQHNRTNIVLCDFGMTESFRERIKYHFSAVMDLTQIPEAGWFKKPFAIYNSPSKKTLWLDTDCEVKANVKPLFNMMVPGKLNMVEDKPWTEIRGEIWHNSGVVGVMGRPDILRRWCAATRENQNVGDQEVLHSLLNPITRLGSINDYPFEWNVMRLATDKGYDGPIKIAHHTGKKGKDKIKGLMQIKKVING